MNIGCQRPLDLRARFIAYPIHIEHYDVHYTVITRVLKSSDHDMSRTQ